MQKYSREEIFNNTLEYFDGDELATNVWINKYALKDSFDNIYELTPDDMHRRLAKEIARIEAKYPNPMAEDQIYELFKNFKYIIPQGGPMTGIGNQFQVASLSNCFVIGSQPPADSYGGIFKIDEEQVQIMKRRGGVGHDLSHLRPHKTPVMNSALTSTGVVPFMERYSNSTREVAQDGRRGALMLTLDIRHPDAESFIDAKMEDGKITGANVSVKISDDFMKAALNGGEFQQQFPIDAKDPDIKINIDAAALWNKIITNAHDKAEPGVLFWDQIIRESPADCYADKGYKTLSTNPCVTGDTLVNTPNGYIRVDELKIGDNVSTILGIEPIDEIEINENTEVFKVSFSDGGMQRVTAAHRYHAIKKGSKSKSFSDLRLDTLAPGDYVRVETTELDQPFNQTNYDTGVKVGILLGDGCYTPDRIKYNGIKIASNIDENHYNNKIIDLFGSHIFNQSEIYEDTRCYNHLIKLNESISILKYLKLDKKYAHEKSIPSEYFNNKSALIGILDGLIASDGNILNSKQYAIRFTTTSFELAQDIRRALLLLGIHGKIYKRDKNKNKSGIINGRQIQRNHDIFRVHILASDIKKYYSLTRLDLLHLQKYNALTEIIKTRPLTATKNYTKIKSIEYDGIETTYDLYCKKSDTWITEGYVQRGCGELPLSPYDSCRLLAINLYSYVENPFTSKATFNFELFKTHVRYAQRIMDDIIDLEIEKIQKIIDKIENDPEEDDVKNREYTLWKRIIEAAKNGRRTGVGITAEGDMLAALSLTYGQDKGIDFAELVQQTIAVQAYTESINMAEERCAFGVWNIDAEKGHPFIERILAELDPETLVKYKVTGRRNISLLTIAPTGTVSLMTQTTSGIEPMFKAYYKRRRKVNPNDQNVVIAYVDNVGDSWEEYMVFHHKFVDWFNITHPDAKKKLNEYSEQELEEIVKISPYHLASSEDVDWVRKVEMQGRIQKWVDHSISVTVNLPADTPVNVVKDVYTAAWTNGCKGVTIYREGSRSGVLITKPKEIRGIRMHRAPKRDKTMECDIHHVSANGKKWYVLVGLMESNESGVSEMRPYEVFAFAQKNIKLPARLKRGTLTRVKRGVYNLETEDGLILENITDFFERNEEEALTRLISLALRHGTNIQFIYEQLSKSEGTIVSFSKAIARTLKSYLTDESRLANQKCENCGMVGTIVFSEGCHKCKNCGHEACS